MQEVSWRMESFIGMSMDFWGGGDGFENGEADLAPAHTFWTALYRALFITMLVGLSLLFTPPNAPPNPSRSDLIHYLSSTPTSSSPMIIPPIYA